MRRFAFSIVAIAAFFVFVAPQEAKAQDLPKHEVSAGYSYRSDDLFTGRLNLNGFETTYTRNFDNGLGIEANFAGHYGDHKHHTAMGGVKYTFSGSKVRPFVHALAGVDVFETSDAGFSMMFGGGVDAKVNDKVSIRVVQVDYNPVLYSSTTLHNVRVSTGIVFTF